MYSLSPLILVSLTLTLLMSNKEEIKTDFEELVQISSIPPRDHESIVQFGEHILLYGGFFRENAIYQSLLSSNDYGLSWIHTLGVEQPKLNDLDVTMLRIDEDMPSGFARFFKWNSRLYLVDADLWQFENQMLTIVKDNLLEGLQSAAELSVLYTKTGVVLIDLSTGHLWKLDKDLNITLSKELIFQGKTLRVRGGSVFENHGNFFIYGGELLTADSEGTSKMSNLNLKSHDGITWMPIEELTRQKVGSPFSNFIWSCSVNDRQGRTWVIGGFDLKNAENTNLVWVTIDGIKFSKVAVSVKDAAFSPRHAPGCIYLEEQNSILIVGGKGGDNLDNRKSAVLSDVWRLRIL